MAIFFSQVFDDAVCVTQDRDDGVLVEVYMRCTVTISHVVIMLSSCGYYVIIMWLSCDHHVVIM